jgi:hypothetical protein
MEKGRGVSRGSVVVVCLVAWGCVRSNGVLGPDRSCVTTRDFFARQVWASFMSATCFKCHAPDGVAVVKRGARFVLQPPTYPGFLDKNLQTLRELSKIEYEGVSELLRKPIGQMEHGGGSPLTEGSPKYGALQELVRRLHTPESCQEPALPPLLPGTQQLGAADTFRKAALDLGGRLPTAEEQQRLAAGGEAALDAALDGLMKEDAFFDRLKEIFNDMLLTDKYRWRGHPFAIQQLNPDEFPAAGELKKKWDADRWAQLSEDERRHLNDALAREPLNLIAYVVKNDRPFTEILTADYTIVDDALAQVYGIHDGLSGVRQAHVTEALGGPVPHAGILSTPMFINRVATTPTNRSRGRARFLLKNFLATDILKLADRPIDVALVTKVDNPTMNAESCVVCHRIIDPIAGGYRGWDEGDYERFKPDRPWHADMVHPGFGATTLPSEKYGSAIQWIAQQIASDSRFDRAAAEFVYGAMTGRQPLAYPAATEADFEGKLRAWDAQDAFFRSAIARFVAEKRNLKTLFKAVIESPSYRAVRVPGALSGNESESDPLGTARLLTPELLNRKIIAITGVHWRKTYDWQKPVQDWLADNGMLVLFGGIDSNNITERVTSVNGIMSNLLQRMSNETACLAVPYEFSLPPEKRLLMTRVRLDEAPLSAGKPVDSAIRDIRANVQALHARILGEQRADTDPEIEATYQVFLETWREGLSPELRKAGLRGPCGLNPFDGSKLDNGIRRDADYTVRAWMAVVSYLLSDARFVYE